MVSLQLLSITCDHRDDTIGRDKPVLKVDGVRVWSGDDFTRGTSAALNTVASRSFPSTGVLQLELWEEDAAPNPDDFLGSHTVSASAAGAGSKTMIFNGSGAEYRVLYRVS